MCFRWNWRVSIRIASSARRRECAAREQGNQKGGLKGRFGEELEPLGVSGFNDAEFRRVQHEARCGVLIAIENVTEDRVPEAGCGVHAQLVAAAGDGLEAHAGAIDLAADDLPTGEGVPAMLVVDDLARTVVDVEAHGQIDHAPVGGDVTFEQRDVGFLRDALFELHGEFALGIGIERDDHEAGRVHVEAMDDEAAGVQPRAAGRIEHRMHAGDHAVGLVLPFAGDAQHTAGLVDDDKARVFKDDGK